MFVFYGLRGFGYPLFAFGFLVWITATGSAARLGAAVGWFYFAFTGGLPTLGSLFSSAVDPIFGQYGTLWVALVIIGLGGAFAFFGSARTHRILTAGARGSSAGPEPAVQHVHRLQESQSRCTCSAPRVTP